MIARQPGLDTRPYPFLLAGRPFLPAARPALEPGSEAEAILLGYGLPAGELTIAGRVLADRQPPRAVAVRIAGRTAGTDGGPEGFTIRVDPGSLDAGDYRLEIEVTDPATGQVTRSLAPFVVR
jgi:hypothetical protein